MLFSALRLHLLYMDKAKALLSFVLMEIVLLIGVKEIYRDRSTFSLS